MTQVADNAYEEIRKRILDGTVPLGGRLKESKLASEIGVSRTPIREALRRLEAEGLVSHSFHQGAQVVSPTDQDMADLFELRLLVEGLGAKLAASRVTAGEIVDLEAAAGAMEELLANPRKDLAAKMAVLNQRFHRMVIESAKSERILAGFTSTVDLPLALRTFQDYSRPELLRSAAQHRDLVSALRAGDPQWAQAVMRNHILTGRSVVLAGRALAAGAPPD
jgi:DNA-binding GntR family transcriptional regulator